MQKRGTGLKGANKFVSSNFILNSVANIAIGKLHRISGEAWFTFSCGSVFLLEEEENESMKNMV